MHFIHDKGKDTRWNFNKDAETNMVWSFLRQTMGHFNVLTSNELYIRVY